MMILRNLVIPSRKLDAARKPTGSSFAELPAPREPFSLVGQGAVVEAVASGLVVEATPSSLEVDDVLSHGEDFGDRELSS